MSKSREIRMMDGNIVNNILLFTLPMMAAGLLQMLYNAADMVVVGNLVSSEALAAVGAASPVYTILTELFFGLSVGIDVAASFAHGAGDERTLKRVIDTAVISSAFVGVAVGILGFFVANPVLALMNTPTEGTLFEDAVLYLRVVSLGIPFTMIYNFLAAILRTGGDTRRPFIYLTAAGLLNVILNVVFVLLGLGIFGVALATVISQGVSALLIFVRILRADGLFSFRFSDVSFSWRQFGRIFYIGILAGLETSLFSVGNAFLQVGVNSLGGAAVAGNTAAGMIENFIWTAASSFQFGTVTFIGKNYGAGNIARVRKIFVATFLLAGLTAEVIGLFCFALRYPLMRLFIRDGAEAVEFAAERAAVTFPLYGLAGFMAVLPSAVRGIGHSMSPTVINVFCVLVLRILWVYTVFAASPRAMTLYLVHPVSWVLTDACLLVVYFFFMKKIKKRIEARKPASD